MIRKSFTSSLLYLQEGDYFSENEFVASDGAFEGDGHFRCSYKYPSNNEVKKLFNLAFHEVRIGIENCYQRTGAWFPILGNKKCKLPYSEAVLFLAIHAASRLHNFKKYTENLSYSVTESVQNHYHKYY
jgi:hypothetical protein